MLASVIGGINELTQLYLADSKHTHTAPQHRCVIYLSRPERGCAHIPT
jgi:hypothetical protein